MAANSLIGRLVNAVTGDNGEEDDCGSGCGCGVQIEEVQSEDRE